MTCSHGDCQEEIFLHWICAIDSKLSEIETCFACTKHVALLRHTPPIVLDGVTQVHEVSSECLHEESSWDLDENCCTLDDPDESEDPALVTHRKPPAYRGR